LGRLSRASAVLVFCVAVFAGPTGASAAGPPEINASWVEGVTATGATLRAEINPNGLSTKYHFEYISDAAYQGNPAGERFLGAVKTKDIRENSSVTFSVSELVQGLAFATSYHYRTVATNEAGTEVEEPGHVLTTQEIGVVFGLLDNRGWELVSPPDKGGGAVAPPGALFGGGDIQAAFGAPELTYGSSTAFGNTAGAPPVSQYISRRAASGWTTENVSTPLESAAYGDHPDGAPYRVFSADLSRALLFGGLACRGGLESCPAPNPPLAGSGAPAGYMAYYLRSSANGALLSLLGAADVNQPQSEVSPQNFEVAFAAASPDLAHVVLSSCAALTANAIEVSGGPERCDPEAQNLYEWSPGELKAINLLPGETATTPGAEIAASIGAVSVDGSRVYWSEGGGLYLREGAQTAQVDESLGGGGAFQVASADGAIAFFTKGGHLYRYDAVAKATADVTPSGGVQGVLGASTNGGYVYFQDAAGLELWHAGATTTVAPGANASATTNFPPATGTARVSPDGLHLAFLSDVELSGHDNLDADTRLPDSEVYLYGPPPAGGAETLVCVSCNPTGERPKGPSTIPGALANGSTHAYKPRALSTDGHRVFFDSEDRLVLQDTNKTKDDVADPHSLPDVYEWEAAGAGSCQRAPGCVNLISSGRNADGGASFLDATGNGSDAFFLTSESLVGADPGSIDAYDAMVGGGIAEGSPVIECIGDACQSLPAPPDDPTPGTLAPNSGNPGPRVLTPKARKRHGAGRRSHHRRRHGKGKHRGRGGH